MLLVYWVQNSARDATQQSWMQNSLKSQSSSKRATKSRSDRVHHLALQSYWHCRQFCFLALEQIRACAAQEFESAYGHKNLICDLEAPSSPLHGVQFQPAWQSLSFSLTKITSCWAVCNARYQSPKATVAVTWTIKILCLYCKIQTAKLPWTAIWHCDFYPNCALSSAIYLP